MHKTELPLDARGLIRQTGLKCTTASTIDVMAGLVLSYYAGAAPGGITAIVSVLLLLLVLFYQQFQDKREARHAQD